MIVLDEHLKSKDVQAAIQNWYTGAVVKIQDLRPGTIIKDDAIPGLLAQENQPIFVTINVTDFWQQLPVTDKYCLACFALSTAEIGQVPDLLRRLLRHTDFNTKAKRAGKAVRINAQGGATFYTTGDSTIRPVVGF